MNPYTIEISVNIEDDGRDISGQVEKWGEDIFDSTIFVSGIEHATNLKCVKIRKDKICT